MVGCCGFKYGWFIGLREYIVMYGYILGGREVVLIQIDLFCPHCKENGDLWTSPREFYRVECKICKRKWEHNELNKICLMLVKKAKRDRSFQHWAECLRIQLQHTINPFTGRYYAKT